MNELERLLAAVSRPEPSDQLDQRVTDVLSQRRPSRLQARWRNVLVWCGTAACVGLIGFGLGRWSSGPAGGEMAIKSELPVSPRVARSDPPAETVLSLPLRQDQLVSLFVQTAAPEGMLGKGPVQVEVSTSR